MIALLSFYSRADGQMKPIDCYNVAWTHRAHFWYKLKKNKFGYIMIKKTQQQITSESTQSNNLHK